MGNGIWLVPENDGLASGAEENDRTKKQLVSLREQAADLWVTQAKLLIVSQPVTGKKVR